MKLLRISNLYKVNIFRYRAIPNLHPEPRYTYVKNDILGPWKYHEEFKKQQNLKMATWDFAWILT